MNAALERTWTSSVQRIRTWQVGQDPTPVYETLGWAVVLSLTGDLQARPRGELDQLKNFGRQALHDTTPDTPDQQRAIVLARAGLAVLHDGAQWICASGDLLRPSPRRVRRMLSGELDGLSAAGCALHLIHHDSTELAALVECEG